MTLERLFLDHLPVIDQVVQFIGRRHHLDPDAVEELHSALRLKILDNDYEVLRKFEGRSSLRTYLTAVAQRHFLDTRTAAWGRWRPCAMARRAGPGGILLDRLITREGMGEDEAVAKVHVRFGGAEADLRRLAAQLPTRTSRRFVGEEHLEGVPAGVAPHGLEEALQREEAGRTEEALEAALQALEEADRLILKYKFVHGLQVSQIARLTGLDQKPLYRRLESTMKVLRRELEARGVSRERIAAVVGHPGTEMGGRVHWPQEENGPRRPSL